MSINPPESPFGQQPFGASYEIRDLKNAMNKLADTMEAWPEKMEAKFLQKAEANSTIDDRIKEHPTISGLATAINNLVEAQRRLLWVFIGAVSSIIVGVTIAIITSHH